ncbi:MAG: ATP-dependent 6-phosphofructokinase [Verrucomicrobiae bacterium]|nr:ATP-dependent 6-phosphofructokinase [Verrucomicrobiae bacterium]
MPLLPVDSLGPARFPGPRSQRLAPRGLIPETLEWIDGRPPHDPRLFLRAGPAESLYFNPAETRAGIVTCGGLCPGLNNVIRSLHLELHHGYGVHSVLGFRDGYRGLDPDRGREPLELTIDSVDDIHRDGGTLLGTSRGPVDVPRAVEHLVRRGVHLLFTIGGDGTQRGARELHVEARKRGHPLAVVGVPKTIDNDVAFVDRTFGFATAVAAAREILDGAHTEAHSAPNGVSLVKLMGRHAGFIAAAATVASQDVNFCLVPEQPFVLEGPDGFLAALLRRVRNRRHAVIAVAEGAGQEHLPAIETARDASGNPRLGDIGAFLAAQIRRAFHEAGEELTLRMFDPSYSIRSRPANNEDAVLCDRFARHAVHAAMAGLTGLVIGFLHGQFIHVPIELLVATPKRLNTQGELWRAVLATTGQEDFPRPPATPAG